MDLKQFGNLESWFLTLKSSDFPGGEDYVAYYSTLKSKLTPIQKQVTQGADKKDGTSLTWHDQSHIDNVVEQASNLLKYTTSHDLSPFESFILLTAIQIHDVMNSDGRASHENKSTDILGILDLGGLIDSVTKRTIKDIVACHSGSFTKGITEEKDKIGFLLQPEYSLKGEKIKIQFIASILRLADEYSDNEYRAMSFLLEMKKIEELSEVHHMYAHCLHSVNIKKDTGIVEFDFHVQVGDALKMFSKFNKGKQSVENVYLIDEIFERTLKSHYETIYCMRYLRPYISITKLSIKIEIEVADMQQRLRTTYELVEKGYPTEMHNIYSLCQDQLKLNGSYWGGYQIEEYIKKHNLK